MLDRDDLVFATCYQLAGEIKEDWEEGRSDEVDQALVVLFALHEPEYLVDTQSKYERERYLIALSIMASTLKTVLAKSDEWKSRTADMVKREIICRIKEYEQRIKDLTEPVLISSLPPVHL